MKPLISVIIPVYNTKRYVRACIDSVLAQSFKDFEIILVNDGSTDGCKEICDEYASDYSIISVIHKKNGGPISARKAGTKISAGKYIAFIDSDDSIEPDMYEEMIGKALEYDADIVISEIIYEDHTGSQRQRNMVDQGFYDKDRLRSEVYPRMLTGGQNGSTGVIPSMCNKLFRRELLENVLGDFEESIQYGEDALCSFPCLLDAERVYVIDKAYYHYRTVPTSIMRTYDSSLISKSVLLIELFDKAFKERGFDGKWQLDHYAARIAIECIRNELLFNKDIPIKKRIRRVSRYMASPRISEAFKTVSEGGGFGDVNDKKVKLLINRRFFLLYLVFLIKNINIKFHKQ